MTATVSVVVVTAGRPQSLSRCLAAIEAGECTPHELVVVDQSSASRPAEVGDAGPARRPRIETRHLRVPRMGVSAARNLGASQADGDHLAFTDDDCVPSPEWLAALIEALQTEHANAATGPCCLSRVSVDWWPCPRGRIRSAASSRPATWRRRGRSEVAETYSWAGSCLSAPAVLTSASGQVVGTTLRKTSSYSIACSQVGRGSSTSRKQWSITR